MSIAIFNGGDNLNPIAYLKRHGFRHAIETIYSWKIDKIIQRILLPFFNNKPLQDIIVIESHNDFDCNGGAFFDYIIRNDYNKKYKIIWLLKHPENKPDLLPENVCCVPQYKPSIKKNYYLCISKYFTSDHNCSKKLRKDQISIFFTHGAMGLKDCSGLFNLPDDLNYCLTASEWWKPFDAKKYGWELNDKRFVICGFPVHDILYSNGNGDLFKVSEMKFSKSILWMPTFYKSIGGRVDNTQQFNLGIPIINSIEDFKFIDHYLRENNMLLIIKIHPKQSLDSLCIKETNNIKILTWKTVKERSIDNYRLMKDVDALISDYSSAAYDFLHLNRPIGYDFSSIDTYERGLIIDNPKEMIAGQEIKNLKDFLLFIENVKNGNDLYQNEREKLLNKCYKYQDGNSCKRIVDLLSL